MFLDMLNDLNIQPQLLEAFKCHDILLVLKFTFVHSKIFLHVPPKDRWNNLAVQSQEGP